MGIKRYGLDVEMNKMVEEHNGPWVRADDTEAALGTLELRVTGLEKMVKIVWGNYREAIEFLFSQMYPDKSGPNG